MPVGHICLNLLLDHELLKSRDTICLIIFSTSSLVLAHNRNIINILNERMSLDLTVKWSSVQFSHSVVSDSLWPHGLQHAKPPCLSPSPGVYSNSCPLSQWCHPTISSSVIPFSSCLQSFPASGSFQMSQLFTSGVQSIGVSASASVLPMNTQDWFPWGWTGWISLQSKGLSRVFSNTIVQKYQMDTYLLYFVNTNWNVFILFLLKINIC